MSDKWAFKIDTIRDREDRLDLRYAIAGPQKPESYLIFLNGRTEWIEKYDYLMEELNLPAGVAILTMDHRGQGASGGARAWIDRYETYVDDLCLVLEHTVGDKPYSILTHSMGGLIGLVGVLSHRLTPNALALSSPLLGMPNDPVPRKIAKPLAGLLTKLTLGVVSSGAGSHTKKSFPNNKLTHDHELFVRMKNGPYKIPGATFGWVNATFNALDFVYSERALQDFTTPTLVLAGNEERVVEFDSFRRWVQKASAHSKAKITYRTIIGGRHELFSEPPETRRRAIAEVRAFLDPYLQPN